MKRLHIGSGAIKLQGYVNIDIEPSHEPDIVGNVLEMSFENVDVIYSCHMAEHLSYPDEIVKFLKLCHGWLRENGILRLAVPNLELAANAYVSGSDMKFLYGADFRGYYYKDCPAERFNFFIKEWQHKMCYDYNLLKDLLIDAGFMRIGKRKANESLIEYFNHDRFISESLYVEAIK